MGVQTVVIKCPFCNQHLRRNMILDLNDQIKKEKTSKKVGYTIGALFFVFAMAMQFLQVFEIIEWLLFLVMIGIGFVWIGFGVKNARKFKQNQSKLFDLTGGREMFDYY